MVTGSAGAAAAEAGVADAGAVDGDGVPVPHAANEAAIATTATIGLTRVSRAIIGRYCFDDPDRGQDG
jgi:hypothetical protein